MVGNRENKRQALVESAFRTIAERGLEGLRLRHVAEQAGIDHSTLHHYFATKQALVSAVLDDATRRFWATLPGDAGPVEQLRHHLAALGAMMRAEPELFTVLAELDLRAHRDPEVGQAIARVETGWRAGLSEMWRRGRDEGAWAVDLDPKTAAETVIAVVKGVRLLPDRAQKVLDGLGHALIRRG